MIARIKEFDTDFTRFLHTSTHHTVQITTNTGTLHVSGALLSQHSKVLEKMFQKGEEEEEEEEEELLLDNYEFVKECLLILHGGSVVLTRENCEEIIKFGIQFELGDLIEQGLEYLADNIDEECLKETAKVCNNVSKFAESSCFDNDVDFVWPLESIVTKLSAETLDEFVADMNTTVGIKAILDMMKNRGLAKQLINRFVLLIDQSNIDEILAPFQQYESYEIYAEAFADCQQDEMSSFFGKIKDLKLCKEQLKIVQNLKKCTLQESETNKLHNIRPDEKDILTSWKSFNEEMIKQFCDFSETNYYIMEVLMSWVSRNKPNSRTVRQLCGLLDTFELEKEYLEHVTEVFKAEGHVISFDLDNCKCRSTNQHVLSLTQSYLNNDVISRTVTGNNDVISRTVTGNWFTTNRFTTASEYRMTISGAGMVWDKKYLAFDFVYGRTVQGFV